MSPPDNSAAITVLKMEIGRLKCCADSPAWSGMRASVLRQIEGLRATVAWLESLAATAEPAHQQGSPRGDPLNRGRQREPV